MPAYGNKNNWKGGVGKWPEIRVRVPAELKADMEAVGWKTANQQALVILQEWHQSQGEKKKKPRTRGK